MSQRPVEDYVLDIVDREQAMRRNLAALRTDFEALIIMLVATGWGYSEISRMLTEHGRGYSTSNMSLIGRRAIEKFGGLQ